MPSQACRNSTMSQQILIEQPLLGFVLDLEKAFNTFGRYPLALLMIRLAVPQHAVVWWFLSLARLARYPQKGQLLCHAIGSTTCAPEGDAGSMVAMAALSAFFHYGVFAPNILPSAYADNWGWLCADMRHHQIPLTHCLNLARSIKLTIDFQKSLKWSVRKKEQKELDCLNRLFPDGKTVIPIKQHAKEVGTATHEKKQIRLQDVEDRFKKAETMANNARRVDLETQDRATVVKMGICLTAVYGSKAQILGGNHFQRLRRIGLTAIVGESVSLPP